jgi:hypothetical protein
VADLLKNPRDLVRPVGWAKQRNVSPNDFCSCVAVNLFRTLIPLGNNAVEIFTDNRVLRGIYNQRKPVLGIAQLARLPPIQFLIRPPHNPLGLLSIADSADDTQNHRAVPSRHRAQADLHREFRSIPAPAIQVQTGAHSSDLRA